MPQTLLEQFLREECTPQICAHLQEAIAHPVAPVSRFELNRFEVTLQHDAAHVVLEDVLDASAAGIQEVSLAEFTAALSRRSG